MSTQTKTSPGVTFLPSAPVINAVVQYLISRGINLNTLPKSTQRAINRAAESGHITYWAADQLCINVLGVHPYTVYGDTWWQHTP